MKRSLVLVLVAAVLIFAPGSANANEEQPEESQIIETIIVDQFQEHLLDRNPTLKTLKNSQINIAVSNSVVLQKNNDQITQLENLKNQLQNDKNDIEVSDEYNTLKNTVKEIETDQGLSWYDIDISTLDPDDAAIINAYQTQVNLIVVLENQIIGIKAQIDGLKDQVGDNQADLANAISRMALNNEKITNELIQSSKKLIFGYDKANIQKSIIEKRLSQLDAELEVMQVRQKLGYVIDEHIDTLIQQQDQLNLTLETIDSELKAIQRQLNIFLGQDVGIELDIVKPVIENNIQDKIRTEDQDIDSVFANNDDIKLQELDLGMKVIELSRINDKYSIPYQIALRERENEELKLDELKRNVHSSFIDIVNRFNQTLMLCNNQNEVLKTEKKKIDTISLKYELGMIAKMDYERGMLEYTINERNLQNTKIDLYMKYLDYEWAINGRESIDS